MSRQLGIGIGAENVRAVLVRRGKVLWRGAERVDAERVDDDDLAAALGRLFDSIPKRYRSGGNVYAAIGPAACQIKRLDGIPVKVTPLVINQLVTAGTDRFFLRNGVPLVVGDAERRTDGWWVGAFEAPVINALRDACVARKWSLISCAPSVTLLPGVLGDGPLTVCDGSVIAELKIKNGTFTSYRRRVTAHNTDAFPKARIPQLSLLAGDVPLFAEAYAAAIGARRSPMALKPRSATVIARRQRRVASLLYTLLGISAAALIAAPGVAAAISARRSAHALSALHEQSSLVVKATSDLQRTTAAGNEIARFAASRRSMAFLLRDFSLALPDSTAMVSFHADSAGGSAVVLAPPGVAVLPAFGRVPHLQLPQVIGSLTRETMGTATLQRMAIRFRFRKGE